MERQHVSQSIRAVFKFSLEFEEEEIDFLVKREENHENILCVVIGKKDFRRPAWRERSEVSP